MILLQATKVVKDYYGLRPLRIDRFALAPGEQSAILGIDAHAAEVLVGLFTGATLPDHGEIELFGQSTASIKDSTAWLSLIDRLGIVSQRTVLLEPLSTIQNLAMPFSLDIEPPSFEVRQQAEAIAAEVGLLRNEWECRVADATERVRFWVRLGRALALNPAVVLLEHPSAGIPRREVGALGRQARRILTRRGVAALTLTADAECAQVIAQRVLKLEAATGQLLEARGFWGTILHRRRDLS